MNERQNAIKVVIQQASLRGSEQDDDLQRVATVYIQGQEYRVYSPPRAIGDALEWVGHFSVHVTDGAGSEIEAPSYIRLLATGAVAEELQKLVHDGKEIRDESRTLGSEDEDRRFARLAIEEARKSVSENDGRPHPKVGAVVVKDGRIVATSHRGEAIGNHAEYIALEKKLADVTVAGATVYTTLEPCTTRNHPKIPCADRLIERKVNRVVMGMLDPDRRIGSLGQRKLRDANIITDFFPHDLMAEVEEMNREFIRNCGSASTAGSMPRVVEPKVDVADKWVSLEYLQRSGLAKELEDQGFELHWSSADKEAERVGFGGWEHVIVNQPEGKKVRLKIHDHPVVGGYMVLLKKRKLSH